MPGFTWKPDSLNPYEIYFTNTSVGSGTLTARWFYGDNGSDSTWNATHVFAAAGTYYTCLRVQGDTSTCYKYFCDSITILPLSTNSNCELNVYPNPTNSSINVTIQLGFSGAINVSMYNSQSIKLMQMNQQGNTGNNTLTIDTRNLVRGLYFIKFIYGNSSCYAKFLKF